MKQHLLILVVALLSNISVFAQTVITGTVVDKNNVPLIGVQVMPEAGGDIVTTDFDGRFEITVPEGTKLRFSMLGAKDQTQAAAEGMVIVMGGKKAAASNSGEWNWREKKWENFLTVTYGASENVFRWPSAQILGLRYGQCRQFGWFVEAMTGMGFHFNNVGGAYMYDKGSVYDNAYDPQLDVEGRVILTGDVSYQFLSAEVGVMCRLGCPLHLCVGGGYAYQSTTYKTTSGKWLEEANAWTNYAKPIPHCGQLDIDLVGQIKHVSILLGWGIIFRPNEGPADWGLKLGIGCALDAPKLNARSNAKKGGNK